VTGVQTCALPICIKEKLLHYCDTLKVDVVFTTGGTGIGPRDITPETVAALCERLIPGIMEHVRAKHGQQNPRARLSRSIAGVAGKTQIYTLPGSVRAVEEYLEEILKTLEHVVYMLHELDVHHVPNDDQS